VESVICFRVRATILKTGEGKFCEETQTGDGKSGHNWKEGNQKKEAVVSEILWSVI